MADEWTTVHAAPKAAKSVSSRAGPKRTKPASSGHENAAVSQNSAQSAPLTKAEAPVSVPPARWRQAASQISSGGSPVVRDASDRPPSPLEAVSQELLAGTQSTNVSQLESSKQAAQAVLTSKLAPWAKTQTKTAAPAAAAAETVPAPVAASKPAEAPKPVRPASEHTAQDGNTSPAAKPVITAPAPAPVAAAPRVAGISYKAVAARSASTANEKGEATAPTSSQASRSLQDSHITPQNSDSARLSGSPVTPDYAQGGLGLGLGSSGAMSEELGLALQGLRLSASPADVASAFSMSGHVAGAFSSTSALAGAPDAASVDAAQAGLISSMMSMMGTGMSPDSSPAGGAGRKPLRLRAAAPEFVPGNTNEQ